jgi:hypothetical protein
VETFGETFGETFVETFCLDDRFVCLVLG